MDGTTLGLVMMSAVALILPIMALANRKVPVGRLGAMTGIWIVVFAVGWIVMKLIGY